MLLHTTNRVIFKNQYLPTYLMAIGLLTYWPIQIGFVFVFVS